jgi:hypothetical protein
MTASRSSNNLDVPVITDQLHVVMGGVYNGPRPGATQAEICAEAQFQPNDRVADRALKHLALALNGCRITSRPRNREEHVHYAR